jgi:hypothetical protein
LNKIVFKYCSNDKIPNELYNLTDSLVGYSSIDNYPIYLIKFKCSIKAFESLYNDNENINIFSEISKHLRNYKIQKIIHKSKGLKYNNDDLEKFSIFLQYYYDEKGNINIIE